MATLLNILSIAVLVLGFGFVIFWHELGHFLAAKAVGIKVEQFAVGMGQAILCWRKGIGLTVGTSADRYQSLIRSEWEKRQGNDDGGPNSLGEFSDKKLSQGPSASEELKLAKDLGLGETEYRLNWIPLGGYVKMLGQDDLDFSTRETDPRAYTSKSISARMFVVSAGVIMNVILAAFLFMILFTWGFKSTPALVGSVLPNSPAARAGFQPGDRILSVNGSAIADFNKLALSTALLPADTAVPVTIRRDGKEMELSVKPEKLATSGNILQMGLSPSPALRGLKEGTELRLKNPAHTLLPDVLALKNEELIVAINGKPIEPELRGRFDVPSNYATLLAALDAADGKPLPLTVARPDGSGRRDITVRPYFSGSFGEETNFAGIVARPMIASVDERSSALGKIMPGDVITAIEFEKTRDLLRVESGAKLREILTAAGSSSQPFTAYVERAGKPIAIPGLAANISLGDGKKGLGVSFFSDADSAVIGAVLPNSAAERAGLMPNSRIISAAGKPVANFFELRRALLVAGAAPVEIITADASAATRPAESKHTLQLSAPELASIANTRPVHQLALDERIEPRKTGSPLTAMKWGVAETRDLIIQGYVTIKRIFERSIPASMMNGPVGIFHMGGLIATQRTGDWILWFLAMISANLAVVNFLPIPIVDGGLFLFLLLEKAMGRPLSPKTQQIIQLAGLALICSVFLFVTYNDIARLLT